MTPDHTPAAAPSAPASADDPLIFAIIYDDYDRRHEIVHTEVAARARFERISDSWNAHLFVKVASNSRDDRHANSNAVFHRASAPADTEGPRGTYGCACVSRDARECMARRYPMTAFGPQPDDEAEYAYLRAERCECMCHQWDDDDDDLG